MNTRIFFDTNVLFYAFSKATPQTHRAEQLLLDGGVISIQVLNELVSTVRTKLKMDWAEVRQMIDSTVHSCPSPLPLTVDTNRSATRICARFGYSIYDGLILASALEAGCTTLYTEDLQHGQIIEGLKIVNPFLT